MRLFRRDALLQFLKPVKRDVDLLDLAGGHLGFGGRQHHDELFSIRRDVVLSTVALTTTDDVANGQRCWFAGRETGLRLDIDRKDRTVALY